MKRDDAEPKSKRRRKSIWQRINENPLPASAIGFVASALLVWLFAEVVGFNLLLAGLALIVLGALALTGVVSAIDTFQLKYLWVVILCLAAMAASGYGAYQRVVEVRRQAFERMEDFAKTAVALAAESDQAGLEKCALPGAVEVMLRASHRLVDAKVEYQGPMGAGFRFKVAIGDRVGYLMNVSMVSGSYKITHFAALAAAASQPAKEDK